jgi:hypothetical protein
LQKQVSDRRFRFPKTKEKYLTIFAKKIHQNRICSKRLAVTTTARHFIILLNVRKKIYSPLETDRTHKNLKGQSHEKVGELRVWGISLGPN